VLLSLVRQTEKKLLGAGHQVLPLALLAQDYLQADEELDGQKQAYLNNQLLTAIGAHQPIEKQSRRLVRGKSLSHCKIVNAYDLTIAPILKGKSNCPAQFGKKPGIIAEMASGFIFAFHLPRGNPVDSSYVMPLIDGVEKVIDKVNRHRKPSIQSLAGDLGLNDTRLRANLHQRGILTVGIPNSIEPIAAAPTKDRIEEILNTPDLNAKPTLTKVKIACACGYSRPFVESLIENLSCRGATHIKYQGHRGAVIQTGMAILAFNAATLMRIRQNRLSKRAQRFRRLFRLFRQDLRPRPTRPTHFDTLACHR
jgi:hypothetical protein